MVVRLREPPLVFGRLLVGTDGNVGLLDGTDGTVGIEKDCSLKISLGL